MAASISFINLTLPLGSTLPNWICHQLINIFIFIVIIIILILVNISPSLCYYHHSPSSIFLFFLIFSYYIMTHKNSQAPDPVSCKSKHEETTKPASGCQFQICCYEKLSSFQRQRNLLKSGYFCCWCCVLASKTLVSILTLWKPFQSFELFPTNFSTSRCFYRRPLLSHLKQRKIQRKTGN